MNMRVMSVSVKGLFGIFDHEVPLQNVDRVTIIHGPNGFGKTVMLRMIAALVEGTTTIFEHTPFSEFQLAFDDGTARMVRRSLEGESESGKSRIKLEFLTRDETGTVTAV